MRLLTERWFIVPGLAMCTAYFAFVSSMEQSAVKSERISLQTVDDVYSLARADNYGELLSKHLLNESDIDYLKMQDACFGRIEQWSLVGEGDFDSSGDPFGGWSHRMNVTRPLADFVENARGSSLHEASISLAYYSDRLITFDSSQEASQPLAGKCEAMDKEYVEGKSKDYWHSHFTVRGNIHVERKGEYWLTTAMVSDQNNNGYSSSYAKQAEGPIKFEYLVQNLDGTLVECIDGRDAPRAAEGEAANPKQSQPQAPKKSKPSDRPTIGIKR